MELTLTDAESIVINTWKIDSDLDLPDLEELLECFYAAEKKLQSEGPPTPTEIPDGSRWIGIDGAWTTVRDSDAAGVRHSNDGDGHGLRSTHRGDFISDFCRAASADFPRGAKWVHEGGHTGEQRLIDAARRLLQTSGHVYDEAAEVDYTRACDLLESIRGKIAQYDKNHPEDNAGCLYFQEEHDERYEAAAKAAATILGVQVVDDNGDDFLFICE